MSEDDDDPASRSVFSWATLSTRESIESYLIECHATGDEKVVRDAEFLAALALEELSKHHS